MNSSEHNGRVNPIEKGVIGVAIFSSAIHLGLIAFAAVKLGITVPTCVTDVKPFTSGKFIKQGPKRYEAHILAKMWGYEPSVIKLPTGSVLDIFLVSKDVNHGFNINRTNVNLMAVPFVVNSAQVKFDRPGTYPVICHEYCGAGHQAMNASIVVADEITEGSAEGIVESTTPVTIANSNAGGDTKTQAALTEMPGKQLFLGKGCIACHTVDGKPGVGPTFKGVYGSSVEFTDGTKHTVDDAYISKCIKEPSKTLIKGFSPVMPVLPVTDQEIHDLTEYIKTLK